MKLHLIATIFALVATTIDGYRGNCGCDREVTTYIDDIEGDYFREGYHTKCCYWPIIVECLHRRDDKQCPDRSSLIRVIETSDRRTCRLKGESYGYCYPQSPIGRGYKLPPPPPPYGQDARCDCHRIVTGIDEATFESLPLSDRCCLARRIFNCLNGRDESICPGSVQRASSIENYRTFCWKNGEGWYNCRRKKLVLGEDNENGGDGGDKDRKPSENGLSILYQKWS